MAVKTGPGPFVAAITGPPGRDQFARDRPHIPTA